MSSGLATIAKRRSSGSKRAVIYARISLDRTGAGLGVERQRDDCARLVADRGWTLVDTLTDNDISAYSGKARPGYQDLLQTMRSGSVDVVVAWHTDRLHRNPVELEEYISVSELSGVSTVTARAGELDLSTAAGRMVARMLGAAARHESEQKSERVSRKRRQDAEAGRAHGPLGYGYDENQAIVPHEARIVRDVAKRLLDGETLYSIAVDLNARGLPTPGAGRWSHNQVAKVVDGDAFTDPTGAVRTVRELPDGVVKLVNVAAAGAALDNSGVARFLGHAGVSPWRGKRWNAEAVTRLPTGHPAAALVRMLGSSDPQANGQLAVALNAAGVESPRTSWRAANLRSMIRRGTVCGWRDFGPSGRGGGDMVAKGDWVPIVSRDTSLAIRRLLDAPGRKRTGRERRHLLSSILVCGRCGAPMSGYTDRRDGKRRYACCSQPGLDRCGRLTVIADPVDEAVVEAVLAALSDAKIRSRQRTNRDDGKVARAEDELAGIRAERDEYAQDAAAGRITRAEWMIVRDGLTERQRRAERALGSRLDQARTVLADVPMVQGELYQWWNDAPLKRQRDVLRAVIEKVVVQPSAHGGNRFDHARLEEPVWRF